MLGPVNAYQSVQQNTQNAQVRNPNAQPFLAQEQNPQRSERLNETRQANEPASQSNASRRANSDFEQEAQLLIGQGNTERGSLLDVIA